MKIEVLSWRKVDPEVAILDYVICVRHIRWAERFRSPCVEAYQGSCTVWRDAVTGQRCGTDLESLLAGKWWLITRGKLDHLKQTEGT